MFNIDRLDRNHLLRHSFILMVATHLTSIVNVLFHVVMGHNLSEEEYGIMVSMLGLILIFATPMMAIQNTLAHFSARLKQKACSGDIWLLVQDWLKILALPAIIILLVGTLSSNYLAGFFNLPNRIPIIITTVIFACIIFQPVFSGALLGIQAFVLASIAGNSWGIMRLLVGIAVVILVAPLATSALVAQWTGVMCSLALSFLALHMILKRPQSYNQPIKGVDMYFFKSLFTLIGFGILMNADVVIAKHYFSPQQAGLFARAATIGRMVVFLPQPIAGALFPKVASGGELQPNHKHILSRAIIFSVVVVGLAVLGCCLFPQIPLLILYKVHNPDMETIALVRALTIALSPLGLTFLLMNFEMAQHRFKCLVGLLLCAVVYIIGVILFHQSFWQIVIVLALVSSASLLILIVGVLKSVRSCQ